MSSNALFLLSLSVVIQFCFMQDLECFVAEPSTSILHLQDNHKELKVIQNANELKSHKTFILVHGWQEWPSLKDYFDLARALVKPNQTNVLLLDYSKWTSKFYYCAHEMVAAAGEALTDFIINGVQNGRINLSKVHLIGHSLGGHVVGYAGRQVNETLGEQVHRITALDPAGPLFTLPFTFDTSLTLRKTDAIVVDVLHTTILIGTRLSLGTVDFYAELVDDGMQPACLDDINPLLCSHSISKRYYMESIYSCGIKAVKYTHSRKSPNKEELVTFGHNMAENVTGEYSFIASSSQPYGKYPIKCNPDLHVDSIFL